MKVTDAQACFSMFGGVSASRAEAVAVKLRAKGLLPKGGRGLYAPSASPTEITVFALAVAGADRAEDAPEAAAVLVDLVNKDGDELGPTIFRHLTFQADPTAIAHIRVAAKAGELWVGFAEVTYTDGRVDRFLRPEMWTGKTPPNAILKAYIGRIGHIGGGVIMALAAKIIEANTVKVPA